MSRLVVIALVASAIAHRAYAQTPSPRSGAAQRADGDGAAAAANAHTTAAAAPVGSSRPRL